MSGTAEKVKFESNVVNPARPLNAVMSGHSDKATERRDVGHL